MFTICGKEYYTKKEFECWCADMYNSYLAFAKNCKYIKCYQNAISFKQRLRDTVIVNFKTHKTGFSRCHRDDEFCTSTGIAIAWARYNNKTVPNVIESAKANNLNIGDKVYYTDSVVLGVCEAYYSGTVYDDATKQVKYLFNVGTVKNPCDRYFAVSDLSNIYVLE